MRSIFYAMHNVLAHVIMMSVFFFAAFTVLHNFVALMMLYFYIQSWYCISLYYTSTDDYVYPTMRECMPIG